MIKFDINNIDSPEITALLTQVLIDVSMLSFRDEENEAFYFYSIDTTIRFSDYEAMARELPNIEEAFYNALQTKNYIKAAIADSDYYAICNHLRDNSPDTKFEEVSLDSNIEVSIIKD